MKKGTQGKKTNNDKTNKRTNTEGLSPKGVDESTDPGRESD